jgi:hypothetical protein
MLVRQKRKTSQFSSNVQRERTRTWRGFGHGAASRLRDGEGSCGEYWGRSSPATYPHHRCDYFLPEASETKEKNKSVQFKRTARTNADMAARAYWDRSSPATCPHHRSDYFLSDASETKEKNKSVQFKRTARTNADMARLRTWRGF